MEFLIVLVLLLIGAGNILGFIGFFMVRGARAKIVGLGYAVEELERRLEDSNDVYRAEVRSAEADPTTHAEVVPAEHTESEQPAVAHVGEQASPAGAMARSSRQTGEEPVNDSNDEHRAIARSAEADTKTHAEVTSEEVAEPEQSPVSHFASFEEKIGRRWITWLGVLALFTGCGFFIKFAIDNAWLPPAVRIIMGAAFGLTMVVGGRVLAKREMHALGQGLTGGGLSILYLSIFAAFSMYSLIALPVALGLMLTVTAGGMFLAVRSDALPISIISTVGGLLTPLLLWSGFTNLDGMMAYILLLDLGVIGVAVFKKWRFLDQLAFAGTWIYFSVCHWYVDHGTGHFAAAAWLMVFFSVFYALPFVHHVVRRTRIDGARFVMTMSNSFIAALQAYILLYGERDILLAALFFGMSLLHVLLAWATRVRIPADESAQISFIAIAVALFTLPFPILAEFNALTTCWALEAMLLTFLGLRYRNEFTRVSGALLALLAIGRVIVQWPWDWDVSGHLVAGAWLPVFNADFGTAVLVALSTLFLGWIYALPSHRRMDRDGFVSTGFGFLGPLMLLGVLGMELFRYLYFVHDNYTATSALAVLLSLGGVGFGALSGSLKRNELKEASWVAVAVGGVFAVVGYIAPAPGDYLLWGNWRFGAGLVVTGAVVYQGWLRGFVPELFGTAIALFFGQLYFEHLVWMQHSGAARWTHILPLYLAIAAATFTVLAWKSDGRVFGWFARFALGAGLVQVIYEYVTPFDGAHLFGNHRFLAGLAMAAAGCLWGGLGMADGKGDRDRYRLGINATGVAVGLTALLAYVEHLTWMRALSPVSMPHLLPLYFGGAAAVYLFLAYRTAQERFHGFALVALTLGVVQWAYAYYGAGMDLLMLNHRFLAALVVVAVCLAGGLLAAKQSDREDLLLRQIYYGGFTFLLLALLTVEAQSFFSIPHYGDQASLLKGMSISVLWGVYAIVAIGVGFWTRSRNVRLFALALFGVTALKLTFVDLSFLKDGYRIVSFIALGALMLGSSYLYHRMNTHFEKEAA